MLTIRLIKTRRGFFEDISVSLWFRIMKTAENLNNQELSGKGFWKGIMERFLFGEMIVTGTDRTQVFC